jgi:CheY-like chemotaxis protein
VLENEGYRVLHAYDGTEALLVAMAHRDVALLILDLNLAGECGWDTFERLTTAMPLLQFFIITARADQHRLADAAGVGALMEKPLDIPKLLEVTRGLIAEDPRTRLARLTGDVPRPLFFGAPEFNR